jgi:hypothetical protein
MTIEKAKKALGLAEDVLSRSPMSCRMWQTENGEVHPQTGISIIRDAIATLTPPVPEAVREAVSRAKEELSLGGYNLDGKFVEAIEILIQAAQKTAIIPENPG